MTDSSEMTSRFQIRSMKFCNLAGDLLTYRVNQFEIISKVAVVVVIGPAITNKFLAIKA